MNQKYNISLSEYSGEVCLVLYHSPCNLNCNWCFNRKNLRNVLLNYDDATTIIMDNREYITSVCLSGGEPLLSPDFYRVCDFVRDEGLKLKVNTNATIPPNDEFLVDYVNISFKGNHKDYLRYGYEGTQEQLQKSIDIYSSHEHSNKVEWSVVYHKLLVDLNDTLRFMSSLNSSPDYFTLTQLQVGECYDDFINDLTPPTHNETRQQAQKFKGIPNEHLMIETKEHGKEILI